MVDPTQGIGNKLPTVASANKPEELKSLRKKDESEESEKSKKKDEVVLSKKALSLLEAEDTARETRGQLESSDQSLGLNPSFDETV